MSIKIGDKAVLFHCFAGCSGQDIIAGLRQRSALPAAPADHDSGKFRARNHDYSKLALSVWRHAAPFAGTLAEHYLRCRSIDPFGLKIRFDASSQLGSGDDKAYAPALIVPIEDDTGVIAIQRTYLKPDGSDKASFAEPKRMLGFPAGGAVRWGGIPTDGILRLAEGAEEAASVMNLLGPGHGVWAALGIERYQTITIPQSVHTIIIYSQHGDEAARAIARATPMLTADGRHLVSKLPPHAGDWNDLLQDIRT